MSSNLAANRYGFVTGRLGAANYISRRWVTRPKRLGNTAGFVKKKETVVICLKMRDL